jgi:DNA-binding response OmpR family regulator
MLLQAILVSRDAIASALVASAFRGAVIDISVVRDSAEAQRLITQRKCDALIVDYTSIPEAASLLATLRRTRSNQRAMAFAIVERGTSVKDVCDHGANFILEKPLSAEHISAALRAAHGLMTRERRRYLRHDVSGTCLVKCDKGEFQLELKNVSEGGLGIEIADFTVQQLSGELRFRFFLPDSDVPIAGKAQLAWTREGRGGIQFSSFASASRDELERWIAQRFDVANAIAAGKINGLAHAG